MSDRPALRIYGAITSTDWAMTPDYLDLMAAIALREHDPVEAVERRLGRRLEHSRETTVRAGVATIPIVGPIFRYANLFTRVSGGVTVDDLALDLTQALDDPAITSILLQIDSPGGEINGINELADMIYAARQQKPIVAYIGALGASAAYWLASAADRIVADATAMVGSIGVIAAVRDPTKAPSRDIEFVSSQSPAKRADPTTDAGRVSIQARIDALADVFIAAVARNRGVQIDDVLSRFGHGDLLVGQAAVDAGMVDALGSYEATLASLTPQPPLFSIYAGDPGRETPMTEEQAQAAAELAALRQQLATERQARITSEARAAIEGWVHDHRAAPGESAHWQALYIQCATDDAERPLTSGSRVDLLTAAFRARPPHAMTQEAAPVTVAVNRSETPAADRDALLAETEAQTRRYAQRMNGRTGK